MKNYKGYEPMRSVLNTDAFDKRRFSEVFEISPGLQRIRAQSMLPTMGALLSDIWASLYKMKPEITSDSVGKDFELNKSLMKIIMMNKSFSTYRSFTRLDDLMSVVATVKIGEMLNRWFAHEIEKSRCDSELLAPHYSVKPIEWEKKLKITVENNSHYFSEALDQAMEETKEVKNDLMTFFSSHRAGSGHAELKRIPLRDKLLLAEKLSVDEKTKAIAKWAGRFKKIARKKQQTEHIHTVERSDVTFGNDLDQLLSMEFSLYMHPVTRIDFLRRFVEGKTMQYEVKSREVLGKGPIILCLDQSGSMQRLETQAKGFTLALLLIARKQKRDLCLILFSTRLHIFNYKKGKVNSSDLTNLATTFLGGGTDFKLPLEAALNVINESCYKTADVVYVTDGEGTLADSFLQAFNKTKRRKGFNVLSLVIGEGSDIITQFSDKVIKIKDFNEQGSYAAFKL